MIGNNLSRKCEIHDKTKTIEVGEELRELMLKLSFEQGKIKGLIMLADCLDDDIEISDEAEEGISDIIHQIQEKEYLSMVSEIQKRLNIDNKFFNYDSEKNIINVFDIDYDEFLEQEGILSKDLTRIIIINEKED